MTTINDLRPHVTHFSEEIRLKASHLEEVRVGGRIMSILPPLNIQEDTQYELDQFYVLQMDDQVGSLYVYASPFMMDAFGDILTEGHHVVLEGYAKIVTRYIKDKLLKEGSVVAYNVKALEDLADA